MSLSFAVVKFDSLHDVHFASALFRYTDALAPIFMSSKYLCSWVHTNVTEGLRFPKRTY
jgi:hypothetical protein